MDWNKVIAKPLSPNQALYLWDLIDSPRTMDKSPLKHAIIMQQDWPMLPYSSETDGESERLMLIAQFLQAWATGILERVADIEKPKPEKTVTRRRAPVIHPDHLVDSND